MTKRSQKLFRQWRKKNTGCMRGLISIFDFRQGRSSPRLLSNKSCGSASNNLGFSNARNKVDLPCKREEDCGDIRSVINLSDTESDEEVRVNPYISRISTLMEKEMSTAHHSRKEFSSKVKWINTEFGTGAATSNKNDKESTKNAALSDTKSNASSNFISQQSDHPDMSMILSSELDLSTFMLDYCSNFLECEKTPLEHRSKTVKQPFKSHQNQLLGEHPGTKMFQKQNDHSFFRKKEKITAIYQSNESNDAKDLDQIVVLKPTQVGNQNLSNAIAPIGSISSHCGLQNKQDGESLFSLKEIRKRFRNVIGTNRKEKHPIAMDGVLHKIPYGKQITNSAENGGEQRLDTYEKKNAFSVDSEISARKKLSKNSAPRVLYTEATFCDEARKHLSDFLRIGSERESFPPTHVSRTLGKILSFPGFNYLSPRLSPAREKDQARQGNRSLLLHRSKEKIDSEHLDILGITDKYLEFKEEMMDDIEIEEIRRSETQSVSISNEDDFVIEEFKEEGSSMLLEPEQSEARFEPSSPSTPTSSKLPVIQESKEIICAMDDADRPSPISVLDPLFFEDIHTPASMLSWRLKETNAKTQTQPRESQIDSSVAALCLTDAETDSISCAKFNESLLFDELEVSYNMYIDDPRLLFDSIDEVLTEIKDRHFSFASQLSCIKSTIIPAHKHEYFMKEACRRIDWHLDVQLPNTLEKTVKKDLDSTVWIDLQFGAENTVSKIGDSILDCLFEEIALELWD